MNTKLPVRPHLDHLRRQAKVLLAELRDGRESAARTFLDHLPEARGMSVEGVRAAGYRLADAQSVVARQTGFASWPALARHVQHLRGLEGEWRFVALEIDGAAIPGDAIAASRLLIDGDRFRTESPEATYEGVFSIDVETTPAQIDIQFAEGPEAGGSSPGLYELDDDRLTLCLSMGGSARPAAFATSPGSGHALERLRRVSATRPENVTGGPARRQLQGEWVAVQLVRGDQAAPDAIVAPGTCTHTGDEVRMTVGGEVVVHARVRIDVDVWPMAIDYLHLSGADAGSISTGIFEWIGDDVRILMPAPGQPRPNDFGVVPADGTLTRWRRRDGH